MLLHYHEYSENLKATSDRVLDWLELPRVAPGEPFHTGKVYRHYYSLEQRRAIRAFLKEFASAETWEQLKEYGECADKLSRILSLRGLSLILVSITRLRNANRGCCVVISISFSSRSLFSEDLMWFSSRFDEIAF